MPRDPAPKRGPRSSRITLREIAAAAHVSVMTVSYALRNSPEVSAAERERIQMLAERLGYRPDPLLSHLMAHLRTQRTPKSAANLALLTMLDAEFVRRLVAGATQRAGKLGYDLTRIDLRTVKNTGALTRTLLARGVAGVVLAPVEDPGLYRDLLDWSQFAAVAMTYSLVNLPVNRVVAHHFDNAVRTFALLKERGYRRIGLAMTPDMEFRANHSYSGAYARLGLIEGDDLPPILLLGEDRRTAVSRWFKRHRPDAVVLANSNHLRESIAPHVPAPVLQATTFVCLDHDARDHVPGIDQLFETIGSHAVDDVVSQIQRGERGLRPNPTVTMVEGQWVESPASIGHASAGLSAAAPSA